MAELNSNHPPLPGFLKVGRDSRPEISSQQRSLLVRKANELFNEGRVADAKRIFITVGYTDGLIRVGDHHMKKNEPLEAFRMYWLAPDRNKSAAMIEKMAQIVQIWLHQDNDASGA